MWKSQPLFRFWLTFFLCLTITAFYSCRYDKIGVEYDGDYPKDIAKIIFTQCSVTGCHTDNDKNATAGLSLQSWNRMFQGGRDGAVVIPYRPDFSTLMYYTNTYSDFGSIHLQPTMPYGRQQLSYDEIYVLYDWITHGAPNENGFVKFSDYQDKTKFYICNRGCDVVTIMDAESGLAMRYIDVGIREDIEEPVMIKVSPDKLYWYVIFNNGTVVQKFRTADNSLVGQINIGQGIWSSVTITGDSHKAFITDAQLNGKVLYVDLENLQVITTWQTGLAYPYDSYLNTAATLLYVAPQQGNYIYKINITNPLLPVIEEKCLDTGIPIDYGSSLDPSSIMLNADETKYFVTCFLSSELRIMQSSNDSLLSVIPLANSPSRMCLSSTAPYLFVSCIGVPSTNHESAIYVINAQTNSYVTDLYAGNQSRGIALDDTGGKLYVVNRNVEGGSSHHGSLCTGKNGYVTIIDASTFQLISNFHAEISVDPYDIVK